MVVFHPVDKAKFKWEELPQAVTNEKGEYSLYTYSSNDGAPAADYTVGIALVPVADVPALVKSKRFKNRISLPFANTTVREYKKASQKTARP